MNSAGGREEGSFLSSLLLLSYTKCFLFLAILNASPSSFAAQSIESIPCPQQGLQSNFLDLTLYTHMDIVFFVNLIYLSYCFCYVKNTRGNPCKHLEDLQMYSKLQDYCTNHCNTSASLTILLGGQTGQENNVLLLKGNLSH